MSRSPKKDAATVEKPVRTFSCKLTQAATPFEHFWELCVGSDQAPIALRADWQAQLKRSHEELGFKFVRFHGLLSDDMGTLAEEEGKLLYSFFNIDQVFDFLLSIGVRPFVELGFMPKTLASGDKSVFRYAANVTPPKDYSAWATLIRRLVTHWSERYGIKEVSEWFFEVWNEPNLEAFWTGSQADYFELYRHTATAIKSIDSQFKVGGPATAKNEWIGEFVSFCESHHLPLDFVSTHHYPTDALGKPGDDTETQLADGHRGILREQTEKVRHLAGERPLYYTEWNSSSNPRDPLHDEPYAAAFVLRTIMQAQGLVQGYSFWTFSDIFAENYFPSVPFHGGFGLLNLQGIAKPMYRAFELLHRLGDQQLSVEGEHATVDVWVVRKGASLTVMLCNHALPRHAIETETVRVILSDAPALRSVTLMRIDDDHANAKARWQAMGSPEYPDAAQRAQLGEASQLQVEHQPYESEGGNIRFEVQLPPQGIAAVTLAFDDSTAVAPAAP